MFITEQLIENLCLLQTIIIGSTLFADFDKYLSEKLLKIYAYCLLDQVIFIL